MDEEFKDKLFDIVEIAEYDWDKFWEEFLKIMPPTCSIEQLKFLNEIVVKGKMATHGKHLTIDGKNGRYYELRQIDFETDLSKLVKGE